MTAIPVLLPPASQPTTQPYLTPAQFNAYPTWLDLDNLVPGGAASLQTDALADALLAASAWADSECEGMRLSAHYVQGENLTSRVAGGRITLQPRDVPIRSIISLEYGWDPSALGALTLPDSSMWVEDGRLVSFRPGGTAQQFTGPAIQFGGGVSSQARAYVQWSYVAGFASTSLAASCSSGASSVLLNDPTGVLPGDTLRIYDQGETLAGASEALTVASSYVPAIPTAPPTQTSVPLAANTVYAHAGGTGITGMPRDLLQAVIAYTVALLMREDVSAEEPDSGFGPAARTTGDGRGGQAAGLVNDASVWLARYRPVWR
jgi:hypothetical protein